MSETTTAQPAGETAAEFLAAVSETAAAQPDLEIKPVDGDTATAAAPDDGETEIQRKAPAAERRLANLTRKLADEARAREAAERRAEATEALLRAAKPEGTPSPATPETDLEAKAAELVARREFDRRLGEIDAAGSQEFGTNWGQAKETLTALGATSNAHFLQALAETENPAKIFAHFAEDTDALLDIMSKSPAAMAARLGRLDAQMAKPASKPLSSAPTPPPRVRGNAAPPDPHPHDYPPNMSMREWNKMMDNYLPPSLGGKRRSA